MLNWEEPGKEIRPTYRSGATASSPEGPPLRSRTRAITATVPVTGTSAANPGIRE